MLKIKELQLLYTIYIDIVKLSHLLSSFCLYIIWKQKLGKLFAFSSWFKHRFPWSKEEENHYFPFTFFDIVSIRPSLFLCSFLYLFL